MVCELDGVSVPCSTAERLHSMGAALRPAEYERWWHSVSRSQPTDIVVNVSPGASYAERVAAYIRALGLDDIVDVSSIQPEPNGGGFVFGFIGTNTPADLASRMSSSQYFGSGGFGLLHIRDVGFPPGDFRSYTNPTAPLSLQINIGPSGVRMDLDVHNPYQDALGLYRHMVCEVMKLCVP